MQPEEEKAQTRELAIPDPIKVRVGEIYRIIANQKIISVVVEKITEDTNNNVTIIFTRPKEGGWWFEKETLAINARDFKARVLTGGIVEATI